MGTKRAAMRRAGMIRAALAAACVSAMAINLAGCDRQEPPVPVASSSPSATATAPIPSAPAPSATPTAEITAPGQPSQSRDPVDVLKAWGNAVQARDWATARAFWGDHGARSGMTEAAFADTWSSLLDPRVTIYKGDQEGAAGSLYYTAPVRIIDGPRTVRGEVVLRRANDVPGATDEQLRWHIESTTLEP
ncbi:MAG: hypothetical protein RIS94_1105 [Pseudomonadota bacterium]|jgi:hypothetical protein